MSDFDDVMERLVMEPAFAAALASDPERALVGYHLTPDERTLLHSQVDASAGPAQRSVETRANQSSMFGLLGTAGAVGHELFGSAAAPSHSGFGASGFGASGLGPAQADGVAGFGPAADGVSGFGPADGGGSGGGIGVSMVGTAAGGDVLEPVGHPHLPAGYDTVVDADADGRWDAHTVVAGQHGGADIRVDLDQDGRVDFVGHDQDLDGRIDSADIDRDGDGFAERTMTDVDGDGWLDRTTGNLRG